MKIFNIQIYFNFNIKVQVIYLCYKFLGNVHKFLWIFIISNSNCQDKATNTDIITSSSSNTELNIDPKQDFIFLFQKYHKKKSRTLFITDSLLKFKFNKIDKWVNTSFETISSQDTERYFIIN